MCTESAPVRCVALDCHRTHAWLLKLIDNLPGGAVGPTQADFVSVQETFGAMAKTEKIAFILEQVRLCLDRKDYVR